MPLAERDSPEGSFFRSSVAYFGEPNSWFGTDFDFEILRYADLQLRYKIFPVQAKFRKS